MPGSLHPMVLPSSPKPYYDEDGITIYFGDNRIISPLLGRFDALVTDPPYGHGKKWSGGTWAANPIYDAAFEWDAQTADLEHLLAMVAQTDAAIVWGGNYYPMPPSRCWLSWEKSSKMPTMADFELAWTNLDRPAKRFLEDRNPDGTREHPTQKPLSLMSWCLQMLPEAKTILDPFMGSGTTLRAAKDLGRRAVGIEVSERYCEVAARKMSQGVLWRQNAEVSDGSEPPQTLKSKPA